MHGSEFIEDDEIEASAAHRIGVIGAGDGDSGAPDEIDAQIGFARLSDPKLTSESFEATPGDLLGLNAGGADIPDETGGGDGGRAQHFSERQVRFAETAAGH